jgi:hypothetical protein
LGPSRIVKDSKASGKPAAVAGRPSLALPRNPANNAPAARTVAGTGAQRRCVQGTELGSYLILCCEIGWLHVFGNKQRCLLLTGQVPLDPNLMVSERIPAL